MSEKYFRGKIIFINNEKQKATIEYINNNKTKTITAIINEKQQEKTIEKKLIKKSHRFLVGDHVKFVIKKSSANIFFADHVHYEFNNVLEVLINKAKTQNKFMGYIKVIDDKYYIKEAESYLFFPLMISKFEIAPQSNTNEKPVSFKLMNIENPEKINAELYNHNYSEGFLIAVKQFKNEQIIKAEVKKISPYGVFVELSDSKIDCKLPIDEKLNEMISSQKITIGSLLDVKIKHISSNRVVIEMVNEDAID